MQTFWSIEPGAYEYRCLHFSPQELADPDKIKHLILRDLQHSGVRARQLQDAVVVLNYLGEAIDSTMARPLVEALRMYGARVAGVFMVPDQLSVYYPCSVIPHWCSNHCGWLDDFKKTHHGQYDLTVDRRLICLNRRRSPLRTRVVQRLLQEFPRNEILLSHECLSGLHEKNPHSLLLDGAVGETKQHRAADRSWLRAAVKIITEGNEQGYPNVPETVLVSEKTFKCFAWRQFPVWISVPGTVQAVRDMGFDVFDDLFDHHRYDLESDQDRRVDQALDLVTDFVSRPLHRLEALRKRMHTRLQNNYRRLDQLAARRDQDLRQAQQRFIKMFAQNDNTSV